MKTQAQSTIEYAVLIAVVVAAIAGMNLYLRRSVQANLKSTEDRINVLDWQFKLKPEPPAGCLHYMEECEENSWCCSGRCENGYCAAEECQSNEQLCEDMTTCCNPTHICCPDHSAWTGYSCCNPDVEHCHTDMYGQPDGGGCVPNPV